VVNCTPIGQIGRKRRFAVPAALFGRGVTLVDLVYNPLETPTMKAARERGARAVGGLEMLVQQGARSFEIWTGKEAPVRAMRAAARGAIRARQRERP
jgi:shikimate 5-dehydrogenase